MFFHEFVHFLLCLTIGFCFSLKYKNFKLLIFSFLIGFFIDIDHIFDYLYWAGWHFNLKDFFNPSLYVYGTNKVFVLLHGWEYLPIIYLLTKKINRKMPGITYILLMSYFFHLFIDQITSAGNIFSYSIIFRILNNFSFGAFS